MDSIERKKVLPLVIFAETTPLFTLDDLRERYGKRSGDRSIRNMVYRLKLQGRIRRVAAGVYTGTLAGTPFNRYAVPARLREDAVVAFHSGLEFHGVANQTFRTMYYLSARARSDVVFGSDTFHRVAPPQQLVRAGKLDFQVKFGPGKVRVTGRERSLIDCLLMLDYSGGVEELDRCLGMFPSFDFEVAVDYLKLLRKPWLYARLGYLLDRHADRFSFYGKSRDRFLKQLPRGVVYLERKKAGGHWVATWNLMVPSSLAPSAVKEGKP